MPPQELIAWCKERKKHLGLTNAKLAEMAGMPQGTVDSLLSNSHQDFKFGTIQPIIQALVGSDWPLDPCNDPNGTADTEKDARIRHLESEIKWRDEVIAEKRLDNERYQQRNDFLRDQIKNRNKAVKILAIVAGIGWVLIIAALIIDRLFPNIGFFWLDGLASLFTGNTWLRLNT